MTTPSGDNGGQSDGGDLNYESTILSGALRDYGSSSSTASSSPPPIPVDSSGDVDIWNLPKYLLGDNAPAINFDIGHSGGSQTAELGMGGDTAVRLDQPNSFNIMAPPVDVMKQFAALSQTDPQQFQALQYQLYQAGFMGDATKVLGGWSTQTENALANAITQYVKVSHGAGVPVSFTQFLQNSVASNAANGNSGLPGQSGSSSITPTVSLTDPTYLASAAQNAAQAALGRNLNQKELSSFIDQFHQQQQQAVNDHASGSNYTLPDAASSAINFVANNDQSEYGQHEVQGYADAFLRMMGVSTAPGQRVAPQVGGE